MNHPTRTALHLLASIALAAASTGCAADASPTEDVGSNDSAWTLDSSYFGVNPAHGGDGGHNYADLDCPTGYVVVGFHGNSGSVIDRVGILCAPMATSGVVGTPVYEPTEVGGTGGNWFNGTCPKGKYGDQLFAAAVAYGVANGLVTRLQLYCASLVHPDENVGWIQIAGNWFDPLQYDNCNGWWGNNDAVTGFRASYVTYVDSMWTQCRKIDP